MESKGDEFLCTPKYIISAWFTNPTSLLTPTSSNFMSTQSLQNRKPWNPSKAPLATESSGGCKIKKIVTKHVVCNKFNV